MHGGPQCLLFEGKFMTRYRKLGSLIRSAVLLAALICAAGQVQANLITIATSGPVTISPPGAPDTFTLNGGSSTFDLLTGVPTSVGFQTGVFNVRFSSFNGTSWNFDFAQLLTINGDAQLVSFSGSVLVTLTVDTLNFFAGPTYWFGGTSVSFMPLSISVPTTTVGQIPFTMMAEVTSVPEPGTLAILGLGLAGLGFIRRKQA